MDTGTRVSQTLALTMQLQEASRLASLTPNDQEAWALVATLAGNIQRRSRLLAGLGRGG